MPLEFDPASSTYYQTSYTELSYASAPVEQPPPSQTAPTDPAQEAGLAVEAPVDPALVEPEDRPQPITPYGSTIGSIVDTVV